MTIRTKRNNIEPMLRQITPMMIISRLGLAKSALKLIGRTKSSISDGMANSCTCFMSLGVFSSIYFCFCNMYCFAIFCLPEFFHIFKTCFSVRLFSFFGLCIALIYGISAYFTHTLIPVFVARMFIKLRNGLNFFTLRTSSCYDWFRHGFLHTRKSCLEPFTSQSCAWLVLLYNRNMIYQGQT